MKLQDNQNTPVNNFKFIDVKNKTRSELAFSLVTWVWWNFFQDGFFLFFLRKIGGPIYE